LGDPPRPPVYLYDYPYNDATHHRAAYRFNHRLDHRFACGFLDGLKCCPNTVHHDSETVHPDPNTIHHDHPFARTCEATLLYFSPSPYPGPSERAVGTC
jgi:hypothetical protein